MDPFIAEIIMFGGNFAPRGWALCNGQLLSISENTALFSILGTTYGGDGRTTFGLPDLRGRSPVHPGNGPGLTPISLGQKSGVETITQPPAHTHSFAVPASDDGGEQDSPVNNFPAEHEAAGDSPYNNTSNGSMGSGTTGSAGQAGGVNVRSPYQAVNFIIALVGIFPSRN